MAQSNSTLREIREFVSVAQPPGLQIYAVRKVYLESDAINAVGQLCRFSPGDTDAFRCDTVLNTNDGLDNVWASPEGNLWASSTDGHVWTTADVDWDRSEAPEVDFEQSDPGFQWKVSKRIRGADGVPYSCSAVGGGSDDDVIVGTFQGTILHWNGSSWDISQGDNTKPIQCMHGTGAANLWAVGRDGLALHYDGSRWRTVPFSGDDGDGENLTGVWAMNDEEAYICSSSGSIYHGSRHGLERLGRYPYGFYGIVEFSGSLYLAGGDAGACRLSGDVVEIVRNTFASSGLFRLQTTLAFVEPDQTARSRIILHDPEKPKPWVAWSA